MAATTFVQATKSYRDNEEEEEEQGLLLNSATENHSIVDGGSVVYNEATKVNNDEAAPFLPSLFFGNSSRSLDSDARLYHLC